MLKIEHLRVCVPTSCGEAPVVDDVSLSVPEGKTVALVGESGCGKSMTALAIMRLLPAAARVDGGTIRLDEAGDLLRLDERRMRAVRGGAIGIIFQEPMTALNPVYTVGEQIVEAVELHQRIRGASARSQAVELLRAVGMAAPGARVRSYPHEMSGGMRQRVMIAMALAGRPRMLIADEPTTALDVTTQAEILALLRSLQAKHGMGVLLITHDLGVVAETADEVYVMYAGRIVEHAATRELLDHPLHPYTQGLLRCTPELADLPRRGLVQVGGEVAGELATGQSPAPRLPVIPGMVPDPAHFPSACRFHPRCSLSAEKAQQGGPQVLRGDWPVGRGLLRRCVEPCDGSEIVAPPLHEVRPDHRVACWEVN